MTSILTAAICYGQIEAVVTRERTVVKSSDSRS